MAAHGFQQGGTIGDLINQTGEDGFVLARTGEEILSLEKIQALEKAFAQLNPIINSLNNSPELSDISQVSGSSASTANVDNINLEITLPNVQSYDDFKDAMQHDKNFESMIRDITVNRIFGGSQLKKYKY